MTKAASLCGFTLAAVLVSVAPSSAASITYSGADVGGGVGGTRVSSDAAYASWLAAAGSISATETFEGIATGSTSPVNLAGGMTLTSNGPVDSLFGLNEVTNNQDNQIGYNTTSGGQNFFRFTSAFGSDATLTITFGAPVTAFGVYVTGVQSDFGTTTASWGASTFALADTAGGAGIGGVQFFGFVSDTPITSISFLMHPNTDLGRRDVIGFDDLQISGPAAAVPEPTTAALVLSGLLGAAVRRRRR